MNDKKLAKLLRSAASALEHGRHTTARSKLSEALPAITKRTSLVVFVEGGIIQTLLALDPRAKDGYRELEYELVDYDIFEGTPAEDIAEKWNSFSPELQLYFETRLTDERARFLAAVAALAKARGEEVGR